MTRPTWQRPVSAVVVAAMVVFGVRELLYADWSPMVPPLDRAPLLLRADAKGSGRFGSPHSGGRSHRGVDLWAPVGSPVRAIRAGRVVKAETHKGLGNYVEIAHRGGLHSLYAHLDRIDVAKGRRVRQGEVIGIVGKTGNAKSPLIEPHLHLEIVRDGKPIDPALLGLTVIETQRNQEPGEPDDEG